ncbi:hypothetical protein LC612_34455 [Nostoc sp. CHAB 5834]|nr:hypothetical protein [Nostoc sp. CHAB 5834]
MPAGIEQFSLIMSDDEVIISNNLMKRILKNKLFFPRKISPIFRYNIDEHGGAVLYALDSNKFHYLINFGRSYYLLIAPFSAISGIIDIENDKIKFGCRLEKREKDFFRNLVDNRKIQ